MNTAILEAIRYAKANGLLLADTALAEYNQMTGQEFHFVDNVEYGERRTFIKNKRRLT